MPYACAGGGIVNRSGDRHPSVPTQGIIVVDSQSASQVIVLIPAYREAARIADTVAAARAIPEVTRVIVVDDGSPDDTAQRAADAGAEVIRMPKNAGKGAALRAGLAACPGNDTDLLLLLDADIGTSASEAALLLEPVRAGDADLAIARFPNTTVKAGFGLVKGLARWGTLLLTGNRLAAPISGQRACRRWVLVAASIADGYGVEVAMNVAAGDAGARIMEVPVMMTHNATGRDLRGFAHRGRQCVHIAGALLSAAFGRTGEPLVGMLHPRRAVCWLFAVLLLAMFVFSGQQWRPAVWWMLPAMILGMLLASAASGTFRARKRNYRGRCIPALGGLFILPVVLVLLHLHRESIFAIVRQGLWLSPTAMPLLATASLLIWMLLGMIDDVWGGAGRKGFRGHLSALMQGSLTTGGVKLLGGGLLALVSAAVIARVEHYPWYVALITALLIALSANMMNLFDLRPGRALKVCWVLLLPLAWLASAQDAEALVLMITVFLLATVLYAPLDFSGMMMLGDTGSNALGALVGLCAAMLLPPLGQLVAVALLAGLHLYAERASISGAIERMRWLRWVDRLGRPEE